MQEINRTTCHMLLFSDNTVFEKNDISLNIVEKSVNILEKVL